MSLEMEDMADMSMASGGRHVHEPTGQFEGHQPRLMGQATFGEHQHEQQEQHQQHPHMMMMRMYFHFGLGDQLLFQSLTLDSSLKLWLACLLLFALAIILEAINFARRIRCRCQLRPFVSARFAKRLASHHQHQHEHGHHHQLNGSTGRDNNQQYQYQQGQQQSKVLGAGSCCRDGQQAVEVAGRRESAESAEAQLCCSSAGTDTLDASASATTHAHCKLELIRHNEISYRLIQTALHVVGTLLALTLMLAAMTYNVCLIFAIVSGKFSSAAHLFAGHLSRLSLPRALVLGFSWKID